MRRVAITGLGVVSPVGSQAAAFFDALLSMRSGIRLTQVNFPTGPEPVLMGSIGFAALVANGTVAALLYAYRDGDANMRSVWLCTRNDAIGNIAVMLAALGVFGTGSGWPDIGVALVMGCLALSAARQVVTRARTEMSTAPNPLTT